MAVNYYIILGINADASDRQIQSAYRERVKEFHPDHYGKDSAPFFAVQEAYAVLKDPVKRRDYDQLLQRQTKRFPMTQRPEPEPLIPERRPPVREMHIIRSFDKFYPSFEQLFDRFLSNFPRAESQKADMTKNLAVEIPISPREAFSGGIFRIRVPAQITCPVCHGAGHVGIYGCWRCSERGQLYKDLPLSISIPAGIPDGYCVEIPLDRYGIPHIYLTAVFRVTNRL